jgi:hypothetical protein
MEALWHLSDNGFGPASVRAPNMPLQPTNSVVTPFAGANRAPAGGRLNGGVRRTCRGTK